MIHILQKPEPAPFEAYLGLICAALSMIIGAELGIISMILEKIL